MNGIFPRKWLKDAIVYERLLDNTIETVYDDPMVVLYARIELGTKKVVKFPYDDVYAQGTLYIDDKFSSPKIAPKAGDRITYNQTVYTIERAYQGETGSCYECILI